MSRQALADGPRAPVADCVADHRSPTPRQVEALAAIIATGTCADAGAMLGISPRTVAVHLANLRRRLGVDTTVQAAYILTARGEVIVPSVGRRVA